MNLLIKALATHLLVLFDTTPPDYPHCQIEGFNPIQGGPLGMTIQGGGIASATKKSAKCTLGPQCVLLL